MSRLRFRLYRKNFFDLLVCIALAFVFVLLSSGMAFGQGNVGINNPTPHAKSLLDLTSTDKGLLTPRLTVAQRTAMFPVPDATAKGMLVYQTDGAIGFYYYDGAAWQMLQAGGAGWGLLGNAGTNVATNFLGTTDNTSVGIRTDNVERMRVSYNGNVSIGAPIDPMNFRLYVESNGLGPNMRLRNMNATGFSGLQCMNDLGTVNGHIGVGNSTAPLWTNMGYAGTISAHPFVLTTSDLERMRIDAAGNVGIGTSAPVRQLELSSPTQGVQRITTNNAVNGSVLELSNATAGNNNLGAINFLEGNVPLAQFAFHKTDGMIFRTGGPERMRIDVAGNVGIGTTAPASKLHVSRGAAGYAPNVNSGLTVEHSGNVYANVISAAGETGVLFGAAANAAHGGIVYHNTPGMTFRTGGNLERMRIDAAGNVGIGTNAPGVKLDVVDGNWLIPMRVRNTLPTGYTAVQYINNNNKFGNIGWGNSASATFADQFYVGTTSPEPLLFTTGDVERARIAANGNVGIGTSTPNYNLHVQSATQAVVWLGSLSSSNGSVLNLDNTTAGANNLGAVNFSDGVNTTGQVSYHTSNGMTFRSGGFERVRIATDGKVGIGTAAPTAELEVNGFTKHGTNAPAIKQVEFTGTTAATEGSFVDIAHGLTVSKIISVEVLIEYTAGSWCPNGYTINPEYHADFVIGATNIRLYNHNGSSGNILSKPLKILVTYKA